MIHLPFISTAALAILCLAVFIWSVLALLILRNGFTQQRINQRLKSLSRANRFQLIPTKIIRSVSRHPRIAGWLNQYKFFRDLDQELSRRQLKMNTDMFLLLLLGLWVTVCVLVTVLADSLLAGLIAASFLAGLPLLYLNSLINRRQELLEEQLPNILDFIARGMQAGHTFLSALQMAASESPEPLGFEFQQTFQEITFGKSIELAMSDLAKRVECEEMSYFAVAVFINHEIGGNLAALLIGVAQMIRDRLKLKLSVHALTAEARVSAWILGSLPFLVGALIFITQPKFISVLWTDPAGRTLTFYTLILMIIGVYWMNRLSKIRY